MQEDPVCGMSVDTEEAESSNYQGKTYYFCSTECKDKFDRNPAEYSKKDSAA
jgi:YHS domain-containing protein